MSNFQVNRGLFMTAADRGLDRLYVEQLKLKDYFPQFSLVGSAGHITGTKGWLKTNVGNYYWIRIVLPQNYPHAMPKIVPEGWQPQTGHGHIYQNGELCVMKPEQWRSHWTLAFMVTKTAVWLNKYEVWRHRGRWPGREQRHGQFGEIFFVDGLFS